MSREGIENKHSVDVAESRTFFSESFSVPKSPESIISPEPEKSAFFRTEPKDKAKLSPRQQIDAMYRREARVKGLLQGMLNLGKLALVGAGLWFAASVSDVTAASVMDVFNILSGLPPEIFLFGAVAVLAVSALPLAASLLRSLKRKSKNNFYYEDEEGNGPYL